MPHSDPEKRRLSGLERKRRFRARKHEERYGANAGDQRGKHRNHVKGPESPRWNRDKKIISNHGYVRIRVGRAHPLADPNGYAYEHLVVWASSGITPPRNGEVIHHRNEDPTDNRIENLEIMARAQHNTHHAEDMTRNPDTGRFVGKHRAGRLLDGRDAQRVSGDGTMTNIDDIKEARRLAMEEAIAACERQNKVFLSPEYATGQPASSLQERFGVTSCINAIRDLMLGES